MLELRNPDQDMDLPTRYIFHVKKSMKKCDLPLFFKRFNETLLFEQRANVNVGYDVISYYVKDSFASLGLFYGGF